MTPNVSATTAATPPPVPTCSVPTAEPSSETFHPVAMVPVAMVKERSDRPGLGPFAGLYLGGRSGGGGGGSAGAWAGLTAIGRWQSQLCRRTGLRACVAGFSAAGHGVVETTTAAP